MIGFKKTSQELLDYSRSQNIKNIKVFASALCVMCLLLIFDNIGPIEGIKNNHILNFTNVGVVFFIFFLSSVLILKFLSDYPKIQDGVIMVCLLGCFLFTSSIGYLDMVQGTGTMTFALGCLMIAVLYSIRRSILISLFVINGIVFYYLTSQIDGIRMEEFRVGIFAIVVLSVLVFITVENQRRNVFISQKKLANKITELNKALDVKSVFFGHMSHELRTPLNAIIGFSDLILQDAYHPRTIDKVKEYVQFINTGGTHLLSLVNDILDQTKIETGEIKVSLEEIEVHTLLKEYVQELGAISISKKQTVKLDIDEDVRVIETDRRLFKQIIYNLLSNAQKYTQSGGMIEIFARGHEGNLEISVKDNGQGMSDDVISSVTETSTPLKTHFVSQAEGTGLGLIIVRQLMHLLGGKISIMSKLDAGTEIKLTFPVKVN